MLKGSDILRIATFNIWNHESLWFEGLEAICEEIRSISPHILALQEVRSSVNLKSKENVARYIADRTGYPFCIFKEHPDSPDEGLAICSKIPIIAEEAIWETDIEEPNYCAIRIMFKYKGYKFGVTNVHLNWKSSRIRQEQMDTVNNWIENVSIFGDSALTSTGVFPSDHYGVFADLEFDK
ncbi:endonuclease/exonuclease/phosphatase family protein [Bacillus luti]|uniref:endonuclease/exonuclease/phosphatase family protein n=1 Tax=Bacillus luti TaxID=2026191 RepID=UPI003D05201F